MFTLAHLSDVHLSPLPTPMPQQLFGKRILGFLNWHVLGRKHQHRTRTLDAIVADLMARTYDHLAVTGDLANIALPDEFTRSLAWLQSIGAPEDVSVVPGNHDAYVPVAPPDGLALWSEYMRENLTGAAFMQRTQSTNANPYTESDEYLPELGFPYLRLLDGPGGIRIALIATSSGIPTKQFMATGELGARQRIALKAMLEQLSGEDVCKVLLIHHPPLPEQAATGRNLTDAEDLAEILRNHQIDLALHGHDHTATLNWGQGPDYLFPVVGIPSASVGHHDHKPLARHNLYDISRKTTPTPGGSAFDISLRAYGFASKGADAGGSIEELENTNLTPPTDFVGEPR